MKRHPRQLANHPAGPPPGRERSRAVRSGRDGRRRITRRRRRPMPTSPRPTAGGRPPVRHPARRRLRIRAPIVGNTTENVNLTSFNESDQLEVTLAQRFRNRPPGRRGDPNEQNEPDSGTVEVFSRNVTQAELLTALQEEGYDVSESDVRNGVTQSTRDEMVSVIDEKLRVSCADRRRRPRGPHAHG